MANKVYAMSEHKLFITTFDDKTLDISEGVDDTGFTIIFDNESITFEESPLGVSQIHRRITKKGKITLSLQWGAIGNGYLDQIFFDQTNGSYIKSCVVKRVNNTENIIIFNCPSEVFISKVADTALGAVGGPRSWVIDAATLTSEERIEVPA